MRVSHGLVGTEAIVSQPTGRCRRRWKCSCQANSKEAYLGGAAGRSSESSNYQAASCRWSLVSRGSKNAFSEKQVEIH